MTTLGVHAHVGLTNQRDIVLQRTMGCEIAQMTAQSRRYLVSGRSFGIRHGLLQMR